MSTPGGPGPTDPSGLEGYPPQPYPAAPADPAAAPTWPATHPDTQLQRPWPSAAEQPPPVWAAPDPSSRYPQQDVHAQRRRGNRGLAAVGVLMMTIAIVGVLAIGGLLGYRAWSMGQLLDGIERSEAAMIAAQELVAATVDGPQDLRGAQGDANAQALQQAAAEAGTELEAAAAEIADVRLAPWDGAMGQARTSYLAHNDAWQAYLAGAAQDPEQWFEVDPEIDRTWNVFVADITDAVPSPDFTGVGQRVEVIVGDPAGSTGDGSLQV